MDLSLMTVGLRLEFEMVSSAGDKVGHTYVSQVLEPVTDSYLIIAAPIHESRVVFVPAQAKVRISFVHRKFGILGVTGVVSERVIRSNIAVLVIQTDGKLEKIQRRQHYRLDCLHSVEYRIVDENAPANSPGPVRNNTPKPEFRKAVTRNISGSGACIVTEENVPRNSVLELFIKMSSSQPVKAICKVLRSMEIEISKGKKYELGVHFMEMSPRDQDFIIKYIFEQQRLLLKKEGHDR